MAKKKGVLRGYYFIHYINSGHNQIYGNKRPPLRMSGTIITQYIGRYSTGNPPRIKDGKIIHGSRKDIVELFDIKEIITAHKMTEILKR